MKTEMFNSEIISSHFESFLSLLGAKNRRENLLQSRKLIRARARPLLFVAKFIYFWQKRGQCTSTEKEQAQIYISTFIR